MDRKPLSETMTVTAWFDEVVIPQEARDSDGALRRMGLRDPDWDHALQRSKPRGAKCPLE